MNEMCLNQAIYFTTAARKDERARPPARSPPRTKDGLNIIQSKYDRHGNLKQEFKREQEKLEREREREKLRLEAEARSAKEQEERAERERGKNAKQIVQ